ncbi:MAG TPA: putative dsRNA-binding protein [Gaiellaceae bacterium]|nr:putative dsRNA-binding protein [Gaiellaceae bacterium]
MPRRSRLSARPSTTSPRTSSSKGDGGALGRLIDRLPPARLEEVFTHPYWAEDRTTSYERLEFLGDAVLDVAIARHLYLEHPDFDEGRMTKVLAHVRSRTACAEVAAELDFERRLRTQGEALEAEEVQSLSRNVKVRAAALEAALGALFLEQSLEPIATAVVEAFSGQIEFALHNSFDAKTELMEYLGKEGRKAAYQVLEAEGPPHDRTFICAVQVDGEQLGSGTGKTKKDAEQEAAREALDALRT